MYVKYSHVPASTYLPNLHRISRVIRHIQLMGKTLIMVTHIVFTSTCSLYSWKTLRGLKFVIFAIRLKSCNFHLAKFSPLNGTRLILNKVPKYKPQYLWLWTKLQNFLPKISMVFDDCWYSCHIVYYMIVCLWQLRNALLGPKLWTSLTKYCIQC